jgi:hypothetical protein
MHRSGTSAVAGAVRLLGADPPVTMLPPAADNPSGFFEAFGVVGVNDWILREAGATWYDCLGFIGNQLEPRKHAMALALINLCLINEFPNASLLLLKDPRLCLLLEYWLPVLQTSHIRPAVLLVLRHPDEVVASLARRDICPAAVSASLWLHHMLTAEYATRGCLRAILPYGALLLDWRGSLSRASNQVAVSWPVAWDLAAASMRQYLDDGLRHHRRLSDQSMIPIGAPQRWLDDAHQALLALAVSDGDPRLWSRLDALRGDFHRWCRQHGRPLTAALLDGHPMREQRMAPIPQEWERLAFQLAQNVAAYPPGV